MFCNAFVGVKVLLGPVVGKVEFQQARVLLEVNRRAVVTAHVATLDAATNSMVEVPQHRVSMQCEADRPVVFVLDRLVPGKRYTVTFGGIRKKDAETKRASFRTQSLEHGNRLNTVVVSGDNVHDMESGEASLWEDIRERVEQDKTQIVLHLGGQVAMKSMFDKAVQLLLLYGEGLSSDVAAQTDWPTMEAKAMDVLRSAYRSQWTLSLNLQFVLANASNLMMWSDADTYPLFTTRDEFYIDHEQPTLRIFVLTNQIPKAVEDLELQKKRHEIEGARRVEKNLRALEAEKAKLEKQLVSYNQLLAPQRGEEFFFEVGHIGILVLDLRSSRLEPGGSQARENELLTNVQWRFIEETLERDHIQLLFVCSEAPLIDNHIPESKRSVVATPEAFDTSLGSNGAAQARLLSQLFDWKLQQPTRKFVLLAGANPVRCFSRMRIKDTKLRTEAEQLTVGTISATPHHTVIPKRNGIIHDRFEFDHFEDAVNKKCFLVLKMESGRSNAFEAHRVGHDKHLANLPKVLLGPVVGWVDDSCAVILLELDQDAVVPCLVNNPLTREYRRIFQRFRAHQANSFFITHLRSEHFYQVSFENIHHPKQLTASFTTVAKFPQHFDVVALCNESKPLNFSDAMKENLRYRELWNTIAENTVEMPFVGLNLTVHLGGQFFPNSDAHIHEALIYAGSTEASLNHNCEDTTAAVIASKIREMYRATWNVPGIRESLAHGAHLVLTNENDELSVNNQDSEDKTSLSVRQLISNFHIQYQNLLLPPSKRLGRNEVRWRKPIYHCFGAFGLFVLPVQDLGGSCIHKDTWGALQRLLSVPVLSRLLLVSTKTLLDESLEDIREKASTDASYRSKFGFCQKDVARLLELLFNWQRTDCTNDTMPNSKREIVLLSGSRYQSFDSVIREVYSSESALISTSFPKFLSVDSPMLFQYVVGPLQAPNSDPHHIALFSQGSLLGRYTYQHTFARKAPPSLTEVLQTSASVVVDDTAEVKIDTRIPVCSTQVSSQLVYLQLVKNEMDHNLAQDSEPTQTEIHSSLGKCCFVSDKPAEFDIGRDNGEDISLLSRSKRVWYCQSDVWELVTVLPVWLQELLAQATTEAEEEQIRDRMSYLREQETKMQSSFQRSPSLVNGLVTFSSMKKCVAVLADSFESAHRHEGSEFRDKFPEAPSRFIVAFTLKQLRTAEPPVESLLSVGAIEFEQYALVFLHSYVNTWLFNTRLEDFWRYGDSDTS
ncbi:unnamed protein product [Phytophthora lilii]|uniref:Unnamed protein product n=1 Tax=Phytophthora lilii TaxID=2077276 RepID=A0A9W6TDQ6_9STRA|nr:unnamed protein product [Phytophthora lilii]